MKLDHKGWAFLILIVGGLVIGSYMLGMQQSEKSSKVTPIPPAVLENSAGILSPAGILPPGAQVPTNHPPMTQPSQGLPAVSASSSKSRFTHFRVGNRNVKGIILDGKVAWIATSGGVIRYDTTDDTQGF